MGGGDDSDAEAEFAAAAVSMLALAILGGGDVCFGGVDGVSDVGDEGVCGGDSGGRVGEGVEGRLGVLAVGEEKGRVAGGLLGGIVVGELGGVQELVPIVLAVVDEAAQHLLGGVVGALGLAVGLGVVGGGHFQLGAGG